MDRQADDKRERPGRANAADHPLRALFNVREGEIGPTLWSAAYFFCLLASYYILRPLRDEISSADRGNLQILWTYVFVIMLIASIGYAAIVARLPRRRFIPLVYRFFAVNILVFFALIHLLPDAGLVWLDRVFYVWLSVFNLFVVSVFWQFMAERHTSEQAKRLFAPIAVGGTLGGIVGAGITTLLLDPPQFIAFIKVEHATLLLISAVLLEAACLCAARLNRLDRRGAQARTGDQPSLADQPVTGTVLEGLVVVFKSPYLLAICAYLVCYTLTATFLYFQQADILRDAFDNRDVRRAFYARIDLIVNTLTIILQCFVTGRLMSKLGVGLTLVLLPIITAVGFLCLGTAHVIPGFAGILWVLVAFQVFRRAGNYALAKPAREVLFTVVSRQEKYKSKAFIDTAVYRGSDMTGGWIDTGLRAVGLGLGAVAFAAAPIAVVWMMLALFLGRRQAQLAESGTVREETGS
ncbi:MAG: hypothetical protein KAS72_07325 [Phycisphaerales bacterium]|nr:hypothetical protein [Phycisphaerales bacterium]